MKKGIKWLFISIVSLIIIGFISFFVWASATYTPSEQLQSLVNIEQFITDDALIMAPEDGNRIGMIVYPGAKVENTAYSYYAQGLMNEGYTVIVPQMPFNFALLSSSKATTYIEQFPQINEWIVGGHSLGGVAAAMYAAKHDVEGLILLAAYPSASTDLKQASFPVLSLYAEHDGLTTLADIEASKALLPSHTVFTEIIGGNHAQFGMYGEQSGDGIATISAVEQQEAMIQYTLEWLEK